jgi:hypothetical protein
MPLSVPNLDDRTYDDLLDEAMRYVPSFAPEWTDHNASDPGVTAIELLAWLAELLIYRTNRVGDRHKAAFVSLVTGKPPRTDMSVDEQMRRAALSLRDTRRAVSPQDFERLAREVAPGAIARTHCVPRRDLSARGPDVERLGHVSVIVVPVPKEDENAPRPAAELLHRVHESLESARLVTTWLHVSPPRYLGIGLSAEVVLKPNARETSVREDIARELTRFLDPIGRPPAYEGWPFGRMVYVSELYRIIEGRDGVDYVASLTLSPEDPHRLERNPANEALGVRLKADELPVVRLERLTTRFPSGMWGE